MARPETQHILMPSILDRLIDPESRGTIDQPWYTVHQMMESVRRDLDELLNTRETHQGLCDDYPEIQNSMITYGLPDLTSLRAETPAERAEIGRALEATIARFEPRLRAIRAVLLDADDTKQRTVRYRIEARLCVDPAPDVAFDATLELATGRYSVKPAGS